MMGSFYWTRCVITLSPLYPKPRNTDGESPGVAAFASPQRINSTSKLRGQAFFDFGFVPLLKGFLGRGVQGVGFLGERGVGCLRAEALEFDIRALDIP